ncbi:MAG: hypothetical protein WBF33_04555 [Candidatus Nitrosopolaris sp.]
MSSPLVKNQVYIIVLDIEGTTTPAEFVYKTLFPYANRKFESFLSEHFQEPEVESLIQQLYSQHQGDERQGLQPSVWIDDEHNESRMRSCVEYCRWLMARDSKSTPLKSLQGKIWEEGYALGELHGQVYADVPPAFSGVAAAETGDLHIFFWQRSSTAAPFPQHLLWRPYSANFSLLRY